MANLLSRLTSALFNRDTTLTTKAPAFTSGGAWSSTLLTSGIGINNSDTPVTSLNVLSLPAAYAATRAISEDVAKLPLVIQRRTARGAWIDDLDHRLVKVLRKPNPWQSRFDAMSSYVMAMQMRGNGYAVVQRGSDGEVTGWIPVGPDYADPQLDIETGAYQYRIQHPLISGTGYVYLPPDEVAQIRNTTYNGGLKGLSPIAVAAEALGIALATQEYAAHVFGQGATASSVIKLDPTVELSPEGRERLKTDLAAKHAGVKNAGKTMVLLPGMSFERIDWNAKEAQWLESRQYSVVEIARIWRIPPSKIGDYTQAHYNNLEAAGAEYKRDTILPITCRIEEAFGEAMLWPEERDRVRFKFLTDVLDLPDAKTRAETYRTYIDLGVLNRNEVRAREGLPPIPDGDRYVTSMNLGDAQRDTDGDGTPDVTDPKPNDPNPDDPDNDPDNETSA